MPTSSAGAISTPSSSGTSRSATTSTPQARRSRSRQRLQDGRQAHPAGGHRAEGVCAGGLRHGHQGARHGARPGDPSPGRRRRSCEGRRELGRRHSEASSGLAAGLAGRRRRQGVGCHQGSRKAQGGVVGREAALPDDGRTLRPHPPCTRHQASSRRTARGRRAPHSDARPASIEARVRVAVPVPCQHGSRLCRGRHQRRRRHRLDGIPEAALRPRWCGGDARRAGREGPRHLGRGPRLLWTKRRRRCRRRCGAFWPGLSVGRSASNTRGNRAPAGIRKGPPRSTGRARPSTRTAA